MRKAVWASIYSFALYVYLIDLRKRYADDDIEIVIDRISTPYKRIQLAKQYARSDSDVSTRENRFVQKDFSHPGGGFYGVGTQENQRRAKGSPSDNARVNLRSNAGGLSLL